jgi:hypothetical protein
MQNKLIRFRIEELFLLLSFFPYVTLVTTPFSLQPYSFLLSIVVLFHYRSVPKSLLPAVVTAIFSLLMLLITGDIFNGLRSVVNYCSFVSITAATYWILKDRPHLIGVFLKVASITYATVGILQRVISEQIFTGVVANQSENYLDSGRGVAALTPEPTFFGFFLLLLIVLCTLQRNFRLVVLNSLSLVFLSQSSGALLLILIFGFMASGVYLISHFCKVFVVFFTAILLGGILLYLHPESRVAVLIDLLISDDILTLATKDESVAGRFYHIATPLTLFFQDWGLPHGYDGLPNGDPRILSGWGGAIYELGIFSIPYIYSMMAIIQKANISPRGRFLLMAGISIFMLNSNQVGMPVVGILMGVLMLQKHTGVVQDRGL